MDNQDIKNALGELEPEEGARIALDYLRGIGRVVKVWEREDIRSIAEQDPEFENLTPEEQEQVLDIAVDDTLFDNLEDATQQDWDAISQAYDAAYAAVRAGNK